MENSFTLSVSANWVFGNWKYKDTFIMLSSYSKSLCGFICKQRSSSSSCCLANGATGHISLWRVDRNLASSCKPYGLGSDFELAQISLASAGMNQAVVSVTLRVAVPQLKREPYELRGCCFCKVQRLSQWWQCLWEIVPVQSKRLWQLFSNLSVCFSRWGTVMRHAVILRISVLRFNFKSAVNKDLKLDGHQMWWGIISWSAQPALEVRGRCSLLVPYGFTEWHIHQYTQSTREK